MTKSHTKLSAEESAMLEGDAGAATALSMQIILSAANATGAAALQPITSAHVVDTLLYRMGKVGPDFIRRLASLNARVRVPTSINTGSIDMLHPEVNRWSKEDYETRRDVMRLIRDMGCSPTYTCSPFQLPQNRLQRGEDVAWGESNAVSFANSVFGARTNRYGNFISIAAAITGRVPKVGLHCEENRRAQVVLSLEQLPRDVFHHRIFFHVLGYAVGRIAGERIPALVGMEKKPSEDDLKAFGAAAAASGAVAMYHIVGVTPEAPTLDEALQGNPPESFQALTMQDLATAYQALSPHHPDESLDAVCLGAPHLSFSEVEEVHALLAAGDRALKIPLYLSMSRHTLEMIGDRGWVEDLKRAGVVIVVDRCSYFPGILGTGPLSIMTDSAKWAHYAPRCIAARASVASLEDCVASAQTGRVVLRSHWLNT